MRILGFSKKWPKLKQPTFTTFRFPRRDRDWEVGELVQVVYKARSKNREILGAAEILSKYGVMIVNQIPPDSICPIGEIGEDDAKADGFLNKREMQLWMWELYRGRIACEPMNKLTLRWISG